ncbi:MAG TPA: HD domain-containing phosphohydrolase [Kineosporiaceae bacterium]|nr:HD domain-containing phosphohydrolase [Kineosporiaceae bacterium]
MDDEPRILDALRRTLHGKFLVETATSGREGLKILAECEVASSPIAVVMSDMMMPGMNGAEFLALVHEIAPDTVRLVLSGQADLPSTIAAINDAELFRFLTKPIDADVLVTTLQAAIAQYDLVLTERELLQQTLAGVAEVLMEVLGLASPLAHRRATRARQMLTTAGEQLGLGGDWRIPLAAMLSQIGCLAVPAPVLAKIEEGRMLTGQERAMYLGHPDVARGLLQRIPRLEGIAEWIGAQVTDLRDLASGPPEEDTSQACFAAVAAFLAGYHEGIPLEETSDQLRACGRFDAAVVEAVLRASGVLEPRGIPKVVPVSDIHAGMYFDQDVFTLEGTVLVRRHEQATETVVQRLRNFAASVGVREPVQVLVPLVSHL